MKKILILICLACAFVQPVQALDIIPADSHFYYDLGGGSDINIPDVTNSITISPISPQIPTNLGFSCSGFNLLDTLKDTFENIGGSIQGSLGGLTKNMTGALAGMAMYEIAKMSKGLYNLIQNTIGTGTANFRASMNDCQGVLNNLNNGKSPIQSVLSVSGAQGWLNEIKQNTQMLAAGQNGKDINNAAKNVGQATPDLGVPWMKNGAQQGGLNQDPIEVVHDVVVAGYNKISGALQPEVPLSKITTRADPTRYPFARYWQDAGDAADWATLVLGDVAISKEQHYPATKHGIGLMALVQLPSGSKYCNGTTTSTGQPVPSTCAAYIAKTFGNLVTDYMSSPQSVPKNKFAAVSSAQLMVTPAILQAIANETLIQQQIAINKWAQDVAIQNVMAKAMSLRRLLIAGKQTAPVQNLSAILKMVNGYISQLQQDMNNVMFQFTIK